MVTSRVLLVAQTAHGGHHPGYLDATLRAAAEAGWRTVVATTESVAANAPIARVLKDWKGRILVLPDGRRRGPGEPVGHSRLLLETLQERSWLAGATARLRKEGLAPDRVFLPFFDAALFGFALASSPFGRTPYAGIAMRIDWPQRGWLRPKLVTRLLKQDALDRLFVIDPYVCERANRAASDNSLPAKVQLIPDPAPPPPHVDRGAARRELGLDGTAPVVLVYGVIDERKGIEPLLEALRGSALRAVHVLIAGQSIPRMEERIRLASESPECQGRIHRLARRLDAREESLVFAAADVVWLVYPGHLHMSGVQILAAHCAVPTLSYRDGAIGKLTEQFSTGLTVAEGDPAALEQGLGLLLHTSDLRARCAAGSCELSRRHGPAAFTAALQSWLSARGAA